MSILRNKFLWASVFILAVWVAVTALVPSDKVRIKKLLETGRTACEKKDVEALMGLIALEYRDPYGLTYATVGKVYEALFEKYDDIKITLRNVKIDVDDSGREATTTFSARGEATVVSTKGDPQNLPVREVGSVDNASLKWKKSPLGWKVVSGEEILPEKR